MLTIVIGLWSLAMAATGLAVLDLTGSVAAASAAATLPLVFGITGLMPHGSWALPMVALVWALTVRAVPPDHDAPPAPVVAAASHDGGAGL